VRTRRKKIANDIVDPETGNDVVRKGSIFPDPNPETNCRARRRDEETVYAAVSASEQKSSVAVNGSEAHRGVGETTDSLGVSPGAVKKPDLASKGFVEAAKLAGARIPLPANINDSRARISLVIAKRLGFARGKVNKGSFLFSRKTSNLSGPDTLAGNLRNGRSRSTARRAAHWRLCQNIPS